MCKAELLLLNLLNFDTMRKVPRHRLGPVSALLSVRTFLSVHLDLPFVLCLIHLLGVNQPFFNFKFGILSHIALKATQILQILSTLQYVHTKDGQGSDKCMDTQ